MRLSTNRLEQYRSPFHWACHAYDPEPVVRLLFSYGPDINAPGKRGDTPLHIACCKRRPAIVRLLLEHGADVNKKNENDDTPLR